jgi:hypothetical protein
LKGRENATLAVRINGISRSGPEAGHYDNSDKWPNSFSIIFSRTYENSMNGMAIAILWGRNNAGLSG